jgi:two-component system response regulator MprA
MARILIVDDHDSTRDYLARILRYKGYQIDEAGDGVQAVERMAACPSDIVLVTVNLPRMSGLEVCCHLRQHTTVPILMISPVPPPFHWKEAQDGKIKAFLPKSTGLKAVLSWLQRVSWSGNGGPVGLLAGA